MIAEVEQLAGPTAASAEAPFSEEFLARLRKLVEDAAMELISKGLI